MQKIKNILTWTLTVVHKSKRIAAGNGEKVVHPCLLYDMT